MMINRSVRFLLGIMLLFIFTPELYAQKKKKEKDEQEKVPVYNYVIDDPMDAFGRTPDTQAITRTVLFPEFYSYKPIQQNDTTLKYECYDKRDSIINVDTLHNIDDVQYISLFKSFTDPAHTYIDKAGKKQLLPVSSIIKRYDKIGAKWMNIDYKNNKYIELREDRNSIVRSDTTTINTANSKQTIIFKYYKVSPTK